MCLRTLNAHADTQGWQGGKEEDRKTGAPHTLRLIATLRKTRDQTILNKEKKNTATQTNPSINTRTYKHTDPQTLTHTPILKHKETHTLTNTQFHKH